MFEISWSELLILGIVILVFVGPKELPVFMRTIGKYAGIVRRHANEFKGQFDAAMKEAELESVREEVEKLQATVNAEVMRGQSSIEQVARGVSSEALGPRESAPTGSAVAAADSLVTDSLSPPMPSPPGREH